MDDMKKDIYLELPALRVKQPLGDFYVISIKANKLLDISFSEPLKYIDSSGNVQGSQRPKDEKRLKEIAKYIDSVEMAFPNSIILAANYTQSGTILKDQEKRWRIEENECGYKLIIPTEIKLAAVIDGQHRLNAFGFVSKEERFNDLELVCSVYFDLPNSYQAFLFATINSNQKRVDRSLALEQFGYNVEDEDEKAWTPEKFAVFLSRKLNIDKNSPFYQHVKVAPLNVEILFEEERQDDWVVSTATIVDGICALISGNPKRDRIAMQQKSIFHGRNRDMIAGIKDISPLRDKFIDLQDKLIYDIIISYFNSIKQYLWNKAAINSYIHKTVGIQASFDVLRLILQKIDKSEINESLSFDKYISPASNINFSDSFFQASGIGRSRIKNVIGITNGLITKDKIKGNISEYYTLVLEGKTNIEKEEKWLWEEEAEQSILNILEKAVWNYDSKSVSIMDDYGYDGVEEYDKYEDFFNKLVEIAENSFFAFLPSDTEFAEEARNKFDAESLVENSLFDYEDNLKKIGWLQHGS